MTGIRNDVRVVHELCVGDISISKGTVRMYDTRMAYQKAGGFVFKCSLREKYLSQDCLQQLHVKVSACTESINVCTVNVDTLMWIPHFNPYRCKRELSSFICSR